MHLITTFDARRDRPQGRIDQDPRPPPCTTFKEALRDERSPDGAARTLLHEDGTSNAYGLFMMERGALFLSGVEVIAAWSSDRTAHEDGRQRVQLQHQHGASGSDEALTLTARPAELAPGIHRPDELVEVTPAACIRKRLLNQDRRKAPQNKS
jgi:predicted membrane GTPase involved in stress response